MIRLVKFSFYNEKDILEIWEKGLGAMVNLMGTKFVDADMPPPPSSSVALCL
jgi:hypothetical protein